MTNTTFIYKCESRVLILLRCNICFAEEIYIFLIHRLLEMKGSNMENGVEKEEFERYTPKNPLPNEIQKMKRDETICKYCGVSYLIHNEIKALEEKLKKTEAELEKLKGCEEREGELKERIDKLEEEKSDLKRNLEAKEIL